MNNRFLSSFYSECSSYGFLPIGTKNNINEITRPKPGYFVVKNLEHIGLEVAAWSPDPFSNIRKSYYLLSFATTLKIKRLITEATKITMNDFMILPITSCKSMISHIDKSAMTEPKTMSAAKA